MFQADTTVLFNAVPDTLQAAPADSLTADSLAIAPAVEGLEILPMEEAFPGSALEMMSSEPAVFPHDTATWEDTPVNSILTIVFILVFLLNLRNFLDILPSIARCFTRWKENLNIDGSVQLARDRNIVAAILVVPFCLIVDRFGIWSPSLLEDMPHWAGSLPVIGAALAYILIRHILVLALRPKRSHEDSYLSMHRSSFTWFIILCIITFLSVAALSLSGSAPETIRRVFLIETAVIYLLFIFSKLQISLSFCNPLSTFLYLCTLEILPTGLLIASAMAL